LSKNEALFYEHLPIPLREGVPFYFQWRMCSMGGGSFTKNLPQVRGDLEEDSKKNY